MSFLNLNSGMKVASGLAIGVAAVLLAPVVFPVVAGVAKSLAKAGIKGGMILYQKGRVAAAEAKETLEDLAAEAEAELSQAQEVAPSKPKRQTAEASAKA